MKKIIYSDLSKVSKESLDALLGDLQLNKTLNGFLMQELGNRRDSVLWDDSIPPEEKIGNIKQITSISDLLLGNGLRSIQSLLRKRMQDKQVVDPEKFKQKVLS